MTDGSYLKKLADMQTQIKELVPDSLKENGERRMRIIDANRLKRSFEANTPLAFQDCVPGIHAIIDLEPTVDAVPIVRCKDCKFRDSELACTQFDVYTSAAGDLFSPPDWFYCGYGKRKEE